MADSPVPANLLEELLREKAATNQILRERRLSGQTGVPTGDRPASPILAQAPKGSQASDR